MGEDRYSKMAGESVFKEIYSKYYAPLCLYAGRFIADHSVCEDIVTDVFARLWRRRNDVMLIPETALAYLKTSIRNGCINFLKHRQYELRYIESAGRREPPYATAPDSVYTVDEMGQLLQVTLERLPEKYRTVFEKCYFEGKSLQELADEMDLSVKSIGRYKQKSTEVVLRRLKDYQS